VANLENVLAIELLAAAQALDLRRPLRSSPPLEELHARLRGRVAPWDVDRYAAPDIEAAREVLVAGIDDLLANLA
jgi:histidine ammonia-lyase